MRLCANVPGASIDVPLDRVYSGQGQIAGEAGVMGPS